MTNDKPGELSLQIEHRDVLEFSRTSTERGFNVGEVIRVRVDSPGRIKLAIVMPRGVDLRHERARMRARNRLARSERMQRRLRRVADHEKQEGLD